MLVDNLGLYDLKHLVGIHVATPDALILVGIGMIAFGFEIDHCFRGIPAIDLVSSPVYENDPVEHFIEGG